MPYPQANYALANIATVVDVADSMLATLANLAQGAGRNNVPVWPPTPPKAGVAEWVLGFMVRQGLAQLDPATVAAGFVDRFDARFPSVTPTNALLFAADIALATAIAGASGRSLAQVYRTAAHINMALWHKDPHHFFVPSL